MKQIHFGYNKKDYLDSGIEGVTPYVGEYIDIVEINDRIYLFTKGILDVKKDMIDVREIIQDVYLDGSYIIYANAVKSHNCQILEQKINEEKVKNAALTGISLVSMMAGSKARVRRPNIIPINNNNQFDMVVLINNQVFESAREILLKYKNKSFIELANVENFVKKR